MRHLRLYVFLFVVAFFAIHPASSQTANPAAAEDETKFRANVRVVLVDVVVTNGKDEPVTGLPKEQFQVLEDGKAQSLASFEEHSGLPDGQALARQAPLPPNVFSNLPAAKTGDSTNVLLLDALNTQMADQSNVHAQMVKYVNGIRPGTRLAVFTLAQRLRLVLGFTSDPALLMAALNGKNSTGNPELSPLMQTAAEQNLGQRAIDQMKELASATGADLQGSIDALEQFKAENTSSQTDVRIKTTLAAMQQLAMFLEGIPGRKNVIWFSGSFPLSSLSISNSGTRSAVPTGLPDPTGVLREYHDSVAATANILAAARVAIYPIGAQGLAANRMYDFSNKQPPKIGGEYPMTQYQVGELQGETTERNAGNASLTELARETGGEAFLNTNGFNDALDHVVRSGTHYYTLTYAPANRNMDGRFRNIEIKVTGGKYHLTFRRGYYATDAFMTSTVPTTPKGDPLRPLMDHGTPDSTELLYTMRVVPASNQPGTLEPGQGTQRAGNNENLKGPVTRYSVTFTVSADHLVLEPSADGAHHGNAEVTLLAYDRDGTPANWMVRMLQFSVPAERFAQVQANGIGFNLEIDVPRTGVYLRSGVYDLSSNKAGTLEIPLAALVPTAPAAN